MLSIRVAYFWAMKSRFIFMVPVSSPPGMERSAGMKQNFWIFWALLGHCGEALYWAMPASMYCGQRRREALDGGLVGVAPGGTREGWIHKGWWRNCVLHPVASAVEEGVFHIP